ncbi:iron-siderophore ABC transporter substrate-binding protein [Sphaerothrix gracilis]|uniref:ABC transporter substrate-binding protein n=1 Tax=Sphaerothrix gracilis TaxID=3151835 RepID=UPI0031FBE960
MAVLKLRLLTPVRQSLKRVLGWQPLALRRIPYVLLFILAVFAIAACNPDAAPKVDSTASTDANCRPVQHAMGESCVPLSPDRVVTLTLPALANLVALDIEPVGTATYEAFAGINLQPYLENAVDGIEWVGSDNQPSLEKIAQLSPDLILGLKKQHQSIYPQLSEIAPTVLFELGDRSNWQQLLLEIAAVFDQTSEAQQLLQDYSHRVDELRQQLGEQGLQQEISIAYALGGSLYSEAKNSFPGSVLEDVGLHRPPAQDVAAPASGRLAFSPERIDSIDGDVLFIPKSGNDLDRDQEALMQKPLWQTLEVVQQDQVYRVNLWEWSGLDILAAHEVLNDLFQYLVNEPPS